MQSCWYAGFSFFYTNVVSVYLRLLKLENGLDPRLGKTYFHNFFQHFFYKKYLQSILTAILDKYCFFCIRKSYSPVDTGRKFNVHKTSYVCSIYVLCLRSQSSTEKYWQFVIHALTADTMAQKQPPEVFYTKAVFKNFNVYTKTPVLEFLFNKVVGLQICNSFKKRLRHKCFPVNLTKLLITPILKSICERLLLNSCHSVY